MPCARACGQATTKLSVSSHEPPGGWARATFTGQGDPEQVAAVSVTDGVLPILRGSSVVAAYIPSRRAAIVDPVVALRAD